MSYSAADNSIDVAYWFFDRAADNMKPLDDAKAQHLVFLSQLLYAGAYDRAMLVPSVFVCSEEGIFEPNLKKILSQGRPFMPRARFSSKINDFLEEIWKRYADYTTNDMARFVKSINIYKENYKKDTKTILDFKSIVESLNKNSKISANSDEKRKILQSQNGPVVVSQWHPRKVSELNSKQGVNHV